MSGTESSTKKCITCGDDLHPERAIKYDYCMKPECQAKNLKGLDMVAVGVNKAAEQYMLLDEVTKADLARGKYHDQRRGTFGQPEPAPGQPGTARPAVPSQPAAAPAAGHRVPAPAGGAVQPAGPAPRRDRPQAGAEPVRRHADHPGGQESQEGLRPGRQPGVSLRRRTRPVPPAAGPAAGR